MKFVVDRDVLAKALQKVGRVASGKGTVTVLRYLLVKANENIQSVELTATNLDTALSLNFQAKVEEAGEALLPASVLSDIVGKLASGMVTIEVIGDDKSVSCTVKAGKSRHTIGALPAEDFPEIPSVENVTEIMLSQGKLKEMLKHTTFAASKEETRSLLMGVLFQAVGTQLSLVATDTHRLAKIDTVIEDAFEKPYDVVVPAQALVELENTLSEAEDVSVMFSSDGSNVKFEFNNASDSIVLTTRMIDGQFPSYAKVIPDEPVRRITFNRVEMLEAIRRVHVMAKSSANKVIFKLVDGVAEITAQSAESGKAYDEAKIRSEALNKQGEGELTIAYNAVFLMELFSLLKAEELTLELRGALNPGVVRMVGDSNFLYVVMPMQV